LGPVLTGGALGQVASGPVTQGWDGMRSDPALSPACIPSSPALIWLDPLDFWVRVLEPVGDQTTQRAEPD
jgi:hypothetical protein